MHAVSGLWLATLIFALIHSGMASDACKRLCAGRMNLTGRRYRLFYTLVSVALTGVWLFYIHALPDRPLYRLEGMPFWLCLALQGGGAWLVWAAFRPINTALFLGLKSGGTQQDCFIETGIYRYLRHPMYSGVMLILWASPVQSLNSLSLTLAVSLYFIIGSRLEERRMLAEHPAYADYRRRVPAFLPRWRSD